MATVVFRVALSNVIRSDIFLGQRERGFRKLVCQQGGIGHHQGIDLPRRAAFDPVARESVTHAHRMKCLNAR